MADPRATIQAQLRGMVNRHFPSQHCAAKEMADFWHHTGNAPIYDCAALSRKMNGTREWGVSDVIALQAICGTTRVSEVMTRASADDLTGTSTVLDPLLHARRLIREHGEGVGALMGLSAGGSRAAARAELQDIVEAAQDAIAMLDKGV